MTEQDPEAPGSVSATRLALLLGGGIVLMLSLLSFLAPLGTPVPVSELERLSEAGQISSIDVGTTAVVVYLKQAQAVQEADGGRPAYTEIVRVFADQVAAGRLEEWTAQGIAVRSNSRTTDGALGPYTWAAVVGFLLLAGGWHLVDQARRHRLHGSPRQRIADLEQQLQQGKIDPDRYRREVEQLSAEL